MDFGENSGTSGIETTPQNQEEVTNLETGGIEHSNGGEPAPDINENNGEGGEQTTSPVKEETKPNETTPANQETKLEAGTQIEVDDTTYTVDKNGNLIDVNGAIFKEAKDVAEWMKSFEKVDETGKEDEISISKIQDALGIDITDDNDKPIEYPNTPEGVKQYVEAVIETSKQEVAEATINSLVTKYPFIQDVINYYVANNNSLEGFQQQVDRSNIEIDENNVEQQKAIIKAAWREQNRKGDVDAYIKYLESTGILLTTAQDELDGLKELDEQRRTKLAEEAQQKEQENLQEQVAYWNGVKEVIDSRKIGKYKIPESIIVERDGKKLSVTPNDFFNYLYQIDAKGYSRYQYDLAKETPESKRDDAILRAYLKFVGGDYSNLVDMAINEKEVQKLRLKAKENHKSQMRITKPATTTKTGGKMDFGD